MGLDKKVGIDVLAAMELKETEDTINYNFKMYCRVIRQLEIMKRPYDQDFFEHVSNKYLDWKNERRIR